MSLRPLLKATAVFRNGHGLRKAIQCNSFSTFASSQILRKELDGPSYSSKPSEPLSPKHVDLPEPLPKGQRKPLPTPLKVLIRRAKEEKTLNREAEQRVLHPPENGLLVPELIKVSHEVYQASITVRLGVSKLLKVLSVHTCRYCPEVHIGRLGHELRTCKGRKSGSRNALHVWIRGSVDHVVDPIDCFHLYDRVGNPRVSHNDKHQIPRIPAIVELCIQAGLDLKECPTRRRVHPVYIVAGQITDFEPSTPYHVKDLQVSNDFCLKELDLKEVSLLSNAQEIQQTGETTLEAWLRMRVGAREIMKKYPVKTCGYCPEIQVGPKGHKVRMCKAPKHQFRDGQHAWQEATLDDLIPPIYVWHVRYPSGTPLKNELRKYYGKAPALVELCVQAGAAVPKEYESMMRLDVAMPALEEADIVA